MTQREREEWQLWSVSNTTLLWDFFQYIGRKSGNHWLESLDFMSFNTHVNHETAVSDPDGHVRIVVAGRNPGVPNWLDTAGHARGGLAFRWVGVGEVPETHTQVVPLSSLR